MRYKLMGLDRFSYEYYSCGIFDSLKEAEKVKRELEANPNSTSGMEDRYWIEHESQCQHCDETFFAVHEIIQHGLKKHHDVMRELGYSEEQLL